MSEQISNPAPAVPAVFLFENHQVRTVEQDGDIWFVAKDITDILGYAKSDSALRSHCKAAKTCSFKMEDQVRVVTIIPERDMYRLVMKSTLPAAEQFEEWVVNDVLPSIRKHGHYSVAPVANSATLPAVSTDPLQLFLITADAVKHLAEKTVQLESRTSQIEEVALEAMSEIEDLKNSRPLLPHQCHAIQKAVAEKVSYLSGKYSIYNRLLFSSIYGFLKRTYSVNTYSAIASIRCDEALMVIKNLTLHQLPDNIVAMAKGGAA